MPILSLIKFFYSLGASLKIDVDVLIRSHGDSQFLFQAIDSVQKQIFTGRVKIHVSAFRTPTHLWTQLEELSRRGSICLHICDQAGYAYPLNLMLECASGIYVAILDHDDLMRENRLQLQFDFLGSHPEISALGSAIRLIDDMGNEIGYQRYESNPEKIRATLLRKNPLAHPAVMLRRSSINSAGCWRGFYDTAEDYDLWLRLSEFSNLSNLPDILSDYRLHKSQVSQTSRRRNLAAGLAAVESARMRRKGKFEVHELFGTTNEYGGQLFVKARVNYMIWCEFLLGRLRLAGLAQKSFRAAVFLFLLFMTNPRKAIWATRLIVRRLKKELV